MDASNDSSVESMNFLANVPVNDRKIVVAIDFGTTFSGIAWAETRRVGSEYSNMQVGIPDRRIGRCYLCNRVVAVKNRVI